MKVIFLAIAIAMIPNIISAQTPPIEPGVPLELAQWRAAHYSNIRYELDIWIDWPEQKKQTLEGKLTIEVDVRKEAGEADVPLILDWRKLAGQEQLSTISYVSLNGLDEEYTESEQHLVFKKGVRSGRNEISLNFTSPILPSGAAVTRYFDKEDGSEYIYSLFVPSDASTAFPVFDQPDLKARFRLSVDVPLDWVVLSNGRADDKRKRPGIAPSERKEAAAYAKKLAKRRYVGFEETKPISTYVFAFAAGPFQEFRSQESEVSTRSGSDGQTNSTRSGSDGQTNSTRSGSDGHKADQKSEVRSQETGISGPSAKEFADALSPHSSAPSPVPIRIFVRKSQAEKFKQHSKEVFRLNRQAISYYEDYFDYPFPFPKYDVVLIPEFPFGGMEHAGATFLRETSVIFPTEPTANNYISRATVIFHEAAHQWFGDTVTMKWFDDLWLKEGFATFMAYKAMEKIMPEYDAWKVFYQRVKPAAYSTDVTKGTVPIYQDIPNLNSAKSAYGNIVYQKAPSFLRQAEFYLGEDKFRGAARSFLKNNEYSNASWSDLVGSFEKESGKDLEVWANAWVKKRSLPIVRLEKNDLRVYPKLGQPHDTAVIYSLSEEDALGEGSTWLLATEVLQRFADGRQESSEYTVGTDRESDKAGFTRYWTHLNSNPNFKPDLPVFVFPNYRDYGYGIFLLDEASRVYILKNIRTEKDEFLRAQMWGSLWDSVRFAELAPTEYVNLAIANIDIESDDTTISSILGRTAYAYTYYLADEQQDEVAPKLEALLIDNMRNAPTVGQRITYYRALLGVAKGEKARAALKELFQSGDRRENSGVRSQESGDRRSDMGVPHRGSMPVARFSGDTSGEVRSQESGMSGPSANDVEDALSTQYSSLSTPADLPFPVRAKDRFDIATRLIEVGDPDGAKFLAELEKTEKDDAALRWAYAAKAAEATKENKAKFWKDFTENKEISESWIEEASGTWNSPSQADLTLPYLAKALALLPDLKRDRKIFFVNNWLGSFIGGQKSEEALKIVNKFLEDNPKMDADLRRKILENVDGLERAVNIRAKFGGGDRTAEFAESAENMISANLGGVLYYSKT
jgi:aminopeptidase N